jgi:hypothetical protein
MSNTRHAAIFTVTAALTIVGLASLWFWDKGTTTLPHLTWLLSILIAEVVGVVVMVGKRGLLYLPDVQVNRNARETDQSWKDSLATEVV